ncbi:MAG TPA: hypothetical protein H9746_03605 [Candidatus Butyricicoccus avistercoris]|uniref:MORN repeat protein n=1 Tax=Candidatus Butyricicoccus avistercoris TaxID=2838518 RepID=A0A9D1TI27_9FIRM|nr:hypothetical protein [Candidatus Butyricicoccus avistercoris]
MKKLLLGLILSSLLLTGCNQNNENASSSQDNNSSVEQTLEVTDKEMTLTLNFWNSDDRLNYSSLEKTGIYTGEVDENGLPSGHGRFDTENSEGLPWYYDGEFSNGSFNGIGKCVWEKQEGVRENDYIEYGNYKDGLFVPTKSQLLMHLGQPDMNFGEFSVSDKSIAFIDSHENLFPTYTESDLQELESYVDRTIEYKHLMKAPDKYLENIIEIKDAIIYQIFENDLCGHTVTSILAGNLNGDYYTIYFDRSLELYQGDSISFLGLPIASSWFENVSGGVTNNFVVYGCSIF